MPRPISTAKIGHTMIVRFTRPEIRNPLSIEVLEELDTILNGLSEQSVEAVIFTGSNSVFASGADLREIVAVRSDQAKEFSLRGQNLTNKIANSAVYLVAAVNGPCFGGALDLALACRRRVASPDATFSHPGANLGIITGWGGTQRLPRLVGEGRALEMFFTARRVGADEAFSIGLIDEVSTDPVTSAYRTAEERIKNTDASRNLLR
jgi:enoyl-CoA hydratase